jgi:hypothetical protein
MPIHPYLTGGTFEPEHIAAMSVAFEEACKALEISAGATREREVIAVRIVELVRRGERSPQRLIARVLEEARAVIPATADRRNGQRPIL